MKKYVKTFEQYNNPDKVFYRADHFKRDTFDQSAYGNQKGMYFTTDQKYAETYGRFISVVNVILNNPLTVDNVNEITDWDFDSDELKKQGYDGLSYTDPIDGNSIEYAFYGNQVKIINKYTLPE